MAEPVKRQRQQPYNTLFLVNLPFLPNEDPVIEMFSRKYKVIHSFFPKSKQKGTFQGYGFITLETTEQCNDALNEFNGMEWEDRKIVVKWAENRKEKDDPNQFKDIPIEEDQNGDRPPMRTPEMDERRRMPPPPPPPRYDERYPPRMSERRSYRPMPYYDDYPPYPPPRGYNNYPPHDYYPPDYKRDRYYARRSDGYDHYPPRQQYGRPAPPRPKNLDQKD